ncbi:hypothetical protein SNE40_018499 [Patella caerulea]|uniref:Uncharacterized protein n=1 Tax=Patella caerulea TaxID=87958 RepID=A0AAN8J6C2_PATCE
MMFPIVKINRCIKSPFLLFSAFFWVMYLLYEQRTAVVTNLIPRQNQKHNISQIFMSPILEREIDRFCMVLEPTENDVYILQGGVGDLVTGSSSDNRLICEVTRMCDRFSFSVQCRSSDCDRYRVDYNLDRQYKGNLTIEGLENIIFDLIYSDRIKGSLESKITVSCVATYVSKVKVPHNLNLEILYSESKFCNDNGLPASNAFQSESPRQFDSRVFYFRHSSRNEFITQFTTFATVHLSMINEKVEVVDFKKVQSTRWGAADNLKMFLTGGSEDGYSWLSDNYCLNFVDFMCNMSSFRKELIQNFTSTVSGPCRQVVSLVSGDDFSIKSIRDFCLRASEYRTSHNTKMSYYYGFYSAYSFAHVGNTFDKPIITTSIVDLENVRSYQKGFMDKALSNIVSELLAKQDSLVVLMSDVGDPSKFNMLSNQFFQTQSSNPFMYFLIPKRLRSTIGEDVISILKFNSNRLITSSDFHVTLQDIMNGIPGFMKDSNSKVLISDPKLGHSLINPSMPSRSCEDLNIKPPGLCICDNTFIPYPNDSVQVAFAEFATGLINNHLQDPVNESFVFCNNLSGHMFTNVRVGRVHGRKHIFFDLVVSMGRSGTLHRFNDIELEIESYPNIKDLTIKLYKNSAKFKNDLKKIKEICCINNNNSRYYNYNSMYANLQGFGVEPDITNLHQKCLILITRNHKDSITYLIGNFCKGRSYEITFDANLVNMVSTISLPIKKDLNPGEIKYLTSIVKSSYTTELFLHAYKYGMKYKIYDEV